jgi:sugar phosphate isomerase/epimerase
MIKLAVNSVLFGAFDFATAAKHIALAGYDAIEISAIKGMCEHLNLDGWKSQASELRKIVADNNLQFASMEVAALDEARLMQAFEAGAALGVPIVNIGPGGKSNIEADVVNSIAQIAKMSAKAQDFGVTLCVKAHVNSAIYNTPTTLRLMQAVDCPAFGVDMDPSHIHRAGEHAPSALKAVLPKVRHVHIRDCQGLGPAPGTPQQQTCGRGDIDLQGYCQVLVEGGYTGPLTLEVIGAGNLSLPEVSIIAAESCGYLNACLKRLKAR